MNANASADADRPSGIGVAVNNGFAARLFLSRCSGITVALLGLAVLYGWISHIPTLTRLSPGLASMKANTAAGLLLSGMALALVPWSTRRALIFLRICASLVLSMSVLTLLEYMAEVDLGIDNLLISGLGYDPPPGRMSIAAVVGLSAAGAALLMFSWRSARSSLLHELPGSASITVAGIGALGIVGYAVDIDTLYSWPAFGTLALHTAVAFCVLGAGLWLVRAPWRSMQGEEVRIAHRATALIAMVSALIGITALAATENSLKTTLAQGLEATLHARAAQIRTSLGLRASRVAAIAGRPDLLHSLRLLIEDPMRSELREVIRREIANSAAADITAIELLDVNDRALARVGKPLPREARGLRPAAATRTWLTWHDRGLHVRHELLLRDGHGRLGTLIAEQYMPEATRGLLGLEEAFGESSRLFLCDRRSRGFECFDARATLGPVVLSDAHPLASLAQRAFEGQRGVVSSLGEQERRSMVGYAPVEPFGLVMLLSAASAEAYRPIGRQFRWVLLLIAATAVAGYFLVSAWVRPLAASLEQRVQMRTAQLAASSARLAVSEQRFRTTFEAAPVAMLVVDSAGRITLVNTQTEKLFGYGREELLGQSVEKLIPASLQSGHVLARQQFMQRATVRQMGVGRELYATRKDGAELMIQVGLSPVQTDAGLTVLATISDLTDHLRQAAALREANAALKQSNLELERFAYVASHDLQTPMRSIASFAELLSSNYADKLDARAGDWLRRIVESITQLRVLVRDLLEYSRIETDAKPAEPVPIEEVFAQVVALLDDAIRATGAQVTCGALPTIGAYRSQVTELLLHLIDNAIKYHGSEPPRVHVSAERVGHEWHFHIADNGIGIAPRHHERIFEIFARLHSQRAFPGTGIGLAACRRIVQRHGGRIWVESAVGKGSVFHFTIPEVEQ